MLQSIFLPFKRSFHLFSEYFEFACFYIALFMYQAELSLNETNSLCTKQSCHSMKQTNEKVIENLLEKFLSNQSSADSTKENLNDEFCT